ncbi:MAG TPA: transglycosylase SLT domain-containing protein [Candidatus Acidoferrales bacterium]|nr:transglycosylase SLT domain-containing protein [Candidatus Acidoferrales bacterium]
MTQDEMIALAKQAAARHGLAPEIVCAVCEQESSWNPWAIRYEPAFRQRYVAPLGLPPTEEIARSMSWGLMQVMGETAREAGFGEKFLSALADPATGLEFGCIVLAGKFRHAALTLAESGASAALAPHELVRSGLELWNGGANPDYAAQALSRADKFR